MSTASSANANAISQTPSVTSDLSSPSSNATISPSWAPPKLPLPPYRLAKIANALGVSTPMPAMHQPTSFMYRSYSDSPTPFDGFGRSLTPSTLNSNSSTYSHPISKYLLHVIPPLHLPHDTDNDNDMTLPPSTASGYHTQFQRGTLVPVHSTLQSQLGAIAKEYALPSTAGLILYLVSSATTTRNIQHTSSPAPSMNFPAGDVVDEPGPRLSEDIWKHLWTRVLKAEQREDMLVSPTLGVPLGMTLSARSTPYLHQDLGDRQLRPFLSTSETLSSHTLITHFPPSPTTPSTVSDARSNAKSTQPSASSVGDPETPDTSSATPSFIQDLAARANSLDLPGLISPSIIPVLAKVEFDIDKRKATWYEPWLRSRRLNHAKRTESRNGRRASITDIAQETDNYQEHQGHIKLLIGQKNTDSATSLSLSSVEEKQPMPQPERTEEVPSQPAEFEQLPEPEEDVWSDDSDEEDDFESTARVAIPTEHDDVFGVSADTLAGMQTSQRGLANNVTDWTPRDPPDLNLSSPTHSESSSEEDEVQALLNQISQPTLSISISSSPPNRRSSSPSGMKKHVPPPLVLVPGVPPKDLIVPTEPSPSPSPMSSASSTGLAYLNNDKEPETPAMDVQAEYTQDEMDDFDSDYTRVRSPEETEKRGGAVFDDLDLGLDPTEDYDDEDPHDRRRSQFIMKAQLDEIERTMAQLSPRILQADLVDEQGHHVPPFSPSGSMSLSPGKMNGDFYPPSPRLPQHAEPDVIEFSQGNLQATRLSISRAASKSSPSLRSNLPPSPPRLTVNGVTTSSPKLDTLSADTGFRRLEFEGHLYPNNSHSDVIADSPIIPLSPDPFGRFSSTSSSRQPTPQWNYDPTTSKPATPVVTPATRPELTKVTDSSRKRSDSSATSRFSADSMTGVEASTNAKSSNRSTLMSVNTFKKLWRKSTKSSVGLNLPPTPSASSFPPLRPERPSQESLDRPKTPTTGRFSPQPMLPRQAPEVPPPLPQVPTPPLHSIQPPHPQHIPFLKQPGPLQQQQQQPAMSSSPSPQQYPAIPPPPPFNGRSMNPQPIVAAQMRPTRSASTLDRLHFDQESPYPTRRNLSYSRPASPPHVAPSPNIQPAHLPPPPTPTMSSGSSALPPPLGPPIVLQDKDIDKDKDKDKDRSSVRKSILKGWKSSSISSTISVQQVSTTPEPRTSLERPNAGVASRGRRPSVLNFGSTRASVVSPLPDIPPSPQIPQQFIARNDNRQSIRSRLTGSSVDLHSPPRVTKTQSSSTASSSPRRSMASSHDSRESRPSFDASQFEIVSPKGSTLTYPYHGLDHSP